MKSRPARRRSVHEAAPSSASLVAALAELRRQAAAQSAPAPAPAAAPRPVRHGPGGDILSIDFDIFALSEILHRDTARSSGAPGVAVEKVEVEVEVEGEGEGGGEGGAAETGPSSAPSSGAEAKEASTPKPMVSLVELALRKMSQEAGRGIRGLALPPMEAGPPMPNWTQLLLRELRRGVLGEGRESVEAGERRHHR